jgi:hypothetical protein
MASPIPEEPPQPSMAVHENYQCDGCGAWPMLGARYVCLDSECIDVHICQSCVERGDLDHPADHRLLKITDPGEAPQDLDGSPEGILNDVLLGLKVYTKRDSPATIKGQLRHGKTLRWVKGQ